MIICFGHEKGGVGKSTLAVSYAAHIAKLGHSVVVIDTDEVGSSAGWYAIRENNGVTPAIPVVMQTSHPESIVLDMSSKFDAVVVDVGASDYETLSKMARICDLWVAPCLLSQNDLSAHIRFHEAMRESGRLHKSRKAIPVVTVLNRTPSVWNSTETEDARDFLKSQCDGITILNNYIRDRKLWRDVGRLGVGISEVTGKDNQKAVDEFISVFDESMQHQYQQEVAA
jgi:chromosome partitioning protein